jgi:Cd2+/Zn2+-exporting ATPase
MSVAAVETALEHSHDESLLSSVEQRSLALRMMLSLIAGACLILSIAIRFLVPGQADVAELVAGLAAAIVAIPALSAAWQSLLHPDLHGITDQLIALALIAAWATGDLITATLLPLVMMVGHILEERSLLGSQEAIRALTKLTEMKARRIENGAVVEVAADALGVGDLIEVRAGDRVAADGIVETGSSNLDTASITGESIPLEVSPGDPVLSGSINLDGLLAVKVTRVGSEATLGRVIALMQDAEHAKPPVTRLLERYAGRYILFVLLFAAAVWFLSGNSTAMLAVLVASCPCALVLAAPATSVAAIAVASRHGILVKGAAFLEHLGTVDSVIFDKTGTVTLGQLRLAQACPAPGVSADEMIRFAGSLGEASSHPVSRTLASLVPASERVSFTDIRETKGLGVVGQMGGERFALGRVELFRELAMPFTPPPTHEGPIAGVSSDRRFLGWILLADEARPEAKAAIAELRALGLERQMLLTGDREAEAKRIAAAVDISEVRAGALPAEKMEIVLAEVRAGRRPLVVGDGINDALALRAGAVGAAMGAQGTDVALASADIVLMSNDLRRLATSLRLSRRCRSTIYVNVGLGMSWTIVVVAAAATGLLGASGALMAAVLHNIGTLVVMANAGRLLRFQEAS